MVGYAIFEFGPIESRTAVLRNNNAGLVVL